MANQKQEEKPCRSLLRLPGRATNREIRTQAQVEIWFSYRAVLKLISKVSLIAPSPRFAMG
jgi:hypothetical protein